MAISVEMPLLFKSPYFKPCYSDDFKRNLLIDLSKDRAIEVAPLNTRQFKGRLDHLDLQGDTLNVRAVDDVTGQEVVCIVDIGHYSEEERQALLNSLTIGENITIHYETK